MTKEEIMTHLSGYRPEIYDDDDPLVAEALKLAGQDPELSEWLDNEIAFDRQFASALGNAPSDQSELESLLSTAEAERSSRSRKRPKVAILLAAAAVILIGAMSVKFFLFPPRFSSPPFRPQRSGVPGSHVLLRQSALRPGRKHFRS